MSVLADRRVVIGLGALVAVAIGATAAVMLGREGDRPPPPAAEGGLQIEIGETERAALDPAKPLRCFVDGKLVGLETLAACAQKNGVAAQALDVGLDETGELAAAPARTPPPAVDVASAEPASAPPVSLPPLTDPGPLGTPATPAVAGRPQYGSCISHGPNGWTTLSEQIGLTACVTMLFDGRCQTPGNALYGRWADQTVRLVPGKVEIAEDGKTFTTLNEHPETCGAPRI